MSDFWKNISRYPRFFISSLIGSILIITTPLKNLLKISKFRLLLIIGILFFIFFLYKTITTMTNLDSLN